MLRVNTEQEVMFIILALNAQHYHLNNIALFIS